MSVNKKRQYNTIGKSEVSFELGTHSIDCSRAESPDFLVLGPSYIREGSSQSFGHGLSATSLIIDDLCMRLWEHEHTVAAMGLGLDYPRIGSRTVFRLIRP